MVLPPPLEAVHADRDAPPRVSDSARVGFASSMLVLAMLAVTPAHAQLRPPDPADWSLIRGERWLVVRAGVGVLWDQPASLAGVRGRLIEAGNMRAEWRSGRTTLEAGGTVVRILDGYSRFAAPVGDTRVAGGSPLRDSGAWRVGSAVRLTAADRPTVAALRFGTRLPNTDDRKGLDRDVTDFYALIGIHARPARLRGAAFSAEAGLGIHGTRTPGVDQADAFLYIATTEVPYHSALFRAAVIGQQTPGRAGRSRGNENLSEVRLGVALGRRIGLQVDGVVGLASYSPDAGILVSTSLRR
jgi:hypothetical protein